ncbi:KTI12 family protein, partial [Patescibacteria group bacterium]|nr:KTI12 family protein [Patescibacteria group bacterium]
LRTKPIATKPVKSSWKLKKKVTQPISDESPASIPLDDLTLTEKKTDVKVPSKGQISFSGSLVSTSDDFSQFVYYEDVLQNILDHLSTASVPVPNSSTVTPLHAQADLLYELDRTSQEIIQLIMTHQSESSEGTPLKLLDYDRSFTLHRPIALSELQRYRRQFVKVNGQHPPTTTKAIGASFIDYLALQI